MEYQGYFVTTTDLMHDLICARRTSNILVLTKGNKTETNQLFNEAVLKRTGLFVFKQAITVETNKISTRS